TWPEPSRGGVPLALTRAAAPRSLQCGAVATSFFRSLRSIEGDGGRLGRWLALPALALLAAWGWWMVAAEVPLHAASASARVVRERARRAAEAARTEVELELASRRLSQRYAAEEAQRLTQLEQTGDVSKLSASRARTEAEKAAVAVSAQEAVLARVAQDVRRDDGDRAAELAQRQRELSEKEGQRPV